MSDTLTITDTPSSLPAAITLPDGVGAATALALLGSTPGRPGDFDFLSGHWNIRHRRLIEGGGDGASPHWDEFDGEASCWGILGGVGSVEELRIPARGFSGLGLRLLDLKAQRWFDFWVNGKSGALTPPGMPGSFERGDGIFFAEERDEQGRPMLVRGIWDRITPQSCRWHQSISYDAGRSWTMNWEMAWTRKSA
ncbi:hypothetical protein G8A07_00095 [Roseateles sp. DAIF2]|uniref:hypothetical protein n=1 Tax=Roseateles sp. DAIF2 TaxID=2714952 RepID=UPI0018A2A4B8|nr:hypothetical protein [Roseateles sp. DAIF2]QPF71476.1 hypothetical protein G8A07_00095 [Roseateles sp. DAIF2]